VFSCGLSNVWGYNRGYFKKKIHQVLAAEGLGGTIRLFSHRPHVRLRIINLPKTSNQAVRKIRCTLSKFYVSASFYGVSKSGNSIFQKTLIAMETWPILSMRPNKLMKCWGQWAWPHNPTAVFGHSAQRYLNLNDYLDLLWFSLSASNQLSWRFSAS